MKQFGGFPEGQLSYTPVPDLFFIDLLPAIDDLAELKVSIYLFWALYHQKGTPRYIALSELEVESALLNGLPVKVGDSVLTVLHQAVSAAVHRGTVLRLDIASDGENSTFLFLNTSQGRKAVREVKDGTLTLERAGRVTEAHISKDRPTLFSLYEQNIGLLTPMLAEQIRDASTTYPEEWLREAFQIAVERNVRNWRYIEAILKRWAIEGKT